MDVKQLRHELTQGIRLPIPELCPNPIVALIQSCFLENPNDRPGFNNVKVVIEKAYAVLMEVSDSKNTKNEEKEGLLYENIATLQVPQDGKMKARYLDMRRENKKHQDNAIVGTHYGGSGDEEDYPNISSRTQNNRYISLDNMLSSASMVPLHGSESRVKSLRDTPSSLSAPDYRPVSVISNKYKQLSPGCNEMKSFFSTSAVNTTEHIHDEDQNRKYTQSWNPLYMMVKSELRLHRYKSKEDMPLTEIEGSGSCGSTASLKPIIKDHLKNENV